MARKPSGAFNKNDYINEFIKEKYDRVNLTMPAGKKDIVRAAAAARGMSVNEYINALITADLESKKESAEP